MPIGSASVPYGTRQPRNTTPRRKPEEAILRTHKLKTWPEMFDAILDGSKPFEVRRDDRSFTVGDKLVLEEWDPSKRGFSEVGYTGRTIEKTITFKLPGGRFGIDPCFCVLGLGPQSAT